MKRQKNKNTLLLKSALLLFALSLVFLNTATYAQIDDSEIFEEAESLEKELDYEDAFEESADESEEGSKEELAEEDGEFEDDESEENSEEFEEEIAEEELEEEPEENLEEQAEADDVLEEEGEQELQEGDEIAVEKGEERIEESDVVEEALPNAVPDTLETVAEEDQEEDGLTGDDSPDSEYEAQLYSIFKDYYSDPISDEKWKEVLNQKEVESYNIVPGDNLWKISQIVFGDGSYWPKVWSLNNSITNPHLIEPDNKINFILGNIDNPPSFSISEQTREPVVETQAAQKIKPDKNDISQFDSDIEIPPPGKTYNPPLKRLPPSIPEWQMVGDFGDYNINGLSGAKRVDLLSQQKIFLSHYILDVAPSSVGKIVEIEENESMAALHQHVYVSLKQGKHKPGDKLMIFKSLGPVRKTNKYIESIPSKMGHVIEVQGEIELLDYMSSSKQNIDLFRARTTKIIYPIQLNSLVKSDFIKKIDFTREGERSEVVAQIIGGAKSVKRNLYGHGEIVFLNRGEASGFSTGQILIVRSNRKIRFPESIIKEDVREIAKIKVIKTGKYFSTALIISSKENIYSGDFTGRGSFVKREGLSASSVTLESNNNDADDSDLESEEEEDQQSVLEEVDDLDESEEDEETIEEASDGFSEEESEDDIDSFVE